MMYRMIQILRMVSPIREAPPCSTSLSGRNYSTTQVIDDSVPLQLVTGRDLWSPGLFNSDASIQEGAVKMRYDVNQAKREFYNYVRREFSSERAVTAPTASPSLSSHQFNSSAPLGSSVDPLDQRGPHPDVGGHQKFSSHGPSQFYIYGPSFAPELTGPEYGSLSPYTDLSPSRSPFNLASTPLTISPALSSTSASPDPDIMALSTIKPHTEFRTIPHRFRHSPPQRELVGQLNVSPEPYFHRASAARVLRVRGRPGIPETSGSATVIPRLLVSPSPIPISSSIQGEMARFLSVSFQDPEDWWRRLVLDGVLQSSFLQNDDMEPLDKGSADPITMGFGKQGRSIYGVFVEEFTRGKWRCLFGSEQTPCPNEATFKRFERAVEHIRSHLNHRPFKCNGTCSPGMRTWCVLVYYIGTIIEEDVFP